MMDIKKLLDHATRRVMPGPRGERIVDADLLADLIATIKHLSAERDAERKKVSFLGDRAGNLALDLGEAQARIAEFHILLNAAPILSKFHGPHGFEREAFIEAYCKWREDCRAALQEQG